MWNELCLPWLRQWLVACSQPSHCLDQCWIVIDSRGLYFNGILIYSFMWENDLEIDVREISATLFRLQCAMKSIMYFWGQPSEWYPFGPCRITYKMMLNSMHCHHIVGLEISAKALMPLSQIPPECARSYCMPFHTSRSTLSCKLELWQSYTNLLMNIATVISKLQDLLHGKVSCQGVRYQWR